MIQIRRPHWRSVKANVARGGGCVDTKNRRARASNLQTLCVLNWECMFVDASNIGLFSQLHVCVSVFVCEMLNLNLSSHETQFECANSMSAPCIQYVVNTIYT